MSKIDLAKFAKSIRTTMVKHSPEILTGIGIAGLLTTTVLAVKATPKAMQLISVAEDEKGEELTAGEKVKATWKCYIPAAVTATISTACLVGASSVNYKRNTALATAYAISETALTEYKDKVIETIGEKKNNDIRHSMAQDKIEKDPVSRKEVIITGRGETLCYDELSKRYFMSDIEALKRAANELNKRMRSENDISLNEFYIEIGLDDIPLGEGLGWSIDRDYIELHLTSHITDDGRPAIVVGHYNPPIYDYRY